MFLVCQSCLKATDALDLNYGQSTDIHALYCRIKENYVLQRWRQKLYKETSMVNCGHCSNQTHSGGPTVPIEKTPFSKAKSAMSHIYITVLIGLSYLWGESIMLFTFWGSVTSERRDHICPSIKAERYQMILWPCSKHILAKRLNLRKAQGSPLEDILINCWYSWPASSIFGIPIDRKRSQSKQNIGSLLWNKSKFGKKFVIWKLRCIQKNELWWSLKESLWNSKWFVVFWGFFA